MSPLAAGLLAGLAVALAVPATPTGRVRSVGRGPDAGHSAGGSPGAVRPPPSRPGRPAPAAPRSSRVAGLLAAVAAGLLVPPPLGPVVAALLWLGTPRLLARLPDPRTVRRDRELARRLPVACDLLAACLAAGVPPEAAVSAVGAAIGGPLGDDLHAVATTWRVTGTADAAFAGVPSAAPGRPLHPVAAACRSSERSGAPPAGLLAALAADRRDAVRRDAEAAARRAGVLAVLPLGLCFLPAFVLVAVVPLVVGLLGILR